MHRSHSFRNPAVLLSLLLVGLSLGSVPAPAQSRQTATRGNEFDGFATFTGVDNNYQPPLANFGVTAGVDYTHFITRFRGLITPSFQLRGTYTPGGSVNLKSVEGGVKIASTYHRFHPYGDILFGNGVITFPKPAVPLAGGIYRDSSFVYIVGGGVTYDVGYTHFSIMADYQHQYYDLGRPAPLIPPTRFYPKVYSLGIVYHIPFKAYKTR
jgi:hypothetical protein